LGWSINVLGSESGQIQSVKLLQKMVSNRTQHPHTGRKEEGRVGTREKVRGATVHKAGSKIPT
jgi:hypothetical protein